MNYQETIFGSKAPETITAQDIKANIQHFVAQYVHHRNANKGKDWDKWSDSLASFRHLRYLRDFVKDIKSVNSHFFRSLEDYRCIHPDTLKAVMYKDMEDHGAAHQDLPSYLVVNWSDSLKKFQKGWWGVTIGGSTNVFLVEPK